MRMVSHRQPRLFGSRRRTEVLTMVALLGETFPSELARLLRAPLYAEAEPELRAEAGGQATVTT